MGDFSARQEELTGLVEALASFPENGTEPELDKKCKKCGEVKSLSAFGPNKQMADGRLGSCRACLHPIHKARLRANAPKCLDCDNKTSSKKCVRCRPCSQKHRSGANHHAFKGGRTVTPRGYVYLSGYPEHPNAKGAGSIAEHVLVMAQMLGRPLTKEENVHHKNGIRWDNRPENLELWSRSQPSGQRITDKVMWAIEILQTYQPQALKEQT